MKTIQELRKCPNCSGKLDISANRKTLICPYCESVFEIEEPEEAENGPGAEGNDSDWGRDDWFEPHVSSAQTIKGKDTRELINCFIKCVGELGTSEKILQYIRYDLETRDGVALQGVNEEKLSAIVSRVRDSLEPGERPLIYGNTALFSNGKKGILVTDIKTLLIGSKTRIIPHDELVSIKFDNGDDIPFIYYNSDEKNKLESIMGADRDMMGAITALICALSFERNPDRSPIILTEEKDD